MNNRTPGRWLVNNNHNVPQVTDGDGRAIANVFNTSGDPRGDALANARLMAKAPQMLSVLKIIRDVYIGNGIPEYSGPAQEVLAAIEAATGGDNA